jgi:hypothetical protein
MTINLKSEIYNLQFRPVGFRLQILDFRFQIADCRLRELGVPGLPRPTHPRRPLPEFIDYRSTGKPASSSKLLELAKSSDISAVAGSRVWRLARVGSSHASRAWRAEVRVA